MLVVDVDGVLSDASGRQHLLGGAERQWAAFFEASLDDPPIVEGIGLVRALADIGDGVGASRCPTVLLTARPSRLADTTMAWMARHGIAWDLLVMRADDDHRSSPDVKREAVADLRATGYEPVLAIDDDPRNAEMYRAEGVPVVYVHSGYYDL
ncbi:MAG: hypothetical protein HOJ86_09730 [Acidimicrobiaceae bacterium]|nr:hypothetical protein [Acidimicrobiaceae bacterium]MBT6372936.1 hypothetical protein [Acidimicrobiaceae bacterium]MDG1464820.1 hypothetical protein [Acidimicrobiales bacterium]